MLAFSSLAERVDSARPGRPPRCRRAIQRSALRRGSQRRGNGAGTPPTGRYAGGVQGASAWRSHGTRHLMDVRLRGFGCVQMPIDPARCPTSAVTAIANPPPKRTRNAALPRGAPPTCAPSAPSAPSATSALTAITATRALSGATMNAPRGTSAPHANDAADTQAACHGRARELACWPSSSRAWAATASRALSCSATRLARSRSRPRAR